jgi:hypothetical protein
MVSAPPEGERYFAVESTGDFGVEEGGAREIFME